MTRFNPHVTSFFENWDSLFWLYLKSEKLRNENMSTRIQSPEYLHPNSANPWATKPVLTARPRPLLDLLKPMETYFERLPFKRSMAVIN